MMEEFYIQLRVLGPHSWYIFLWSNVASACPEVQNGPGPPFRHKPTSAHCTGACASVLFSILHFCSCLYRLYCLYCTCAVHLPLSPVLYLCTCLEVQHHLAAASRPRVIGHLRRGFKTATEYMYGRRALHKFGEIWDQALIDLKNIFNTVPYLE